MNRDIYKIALGKIEASDAFKIKLEASLKQAKPGQNSFKIKRLVPAFIALFIIICISTLTIPGLKHIFVKNNVNDVNDVNDEFKIIDETSIDNASYASVIYMDGYVYSPSEWLNYSRYNSDITNYDEIKGKKLGEVTLDLKGKRYTGTPPDFSSTHDIGTEVYSISNIKKERAILVMDKSNISIFYRQRKAVSDDKTPINLTISDIIHMLSDSPEVTAVELRDENDGSWMRTTEKESLLSLVNRELPELAVLSSHELGENPYDDGRRIPVNLILADGAALHMQVFPDENCASVFGGYIRLTPELCNEIQELFNSGDQYPSISDLLPYKENDIAYMHLLNNTNGDEIICENPQWSRSALYSILNYYRVEEVKEDIDKNLIMTGIIGLSKENSMTVRFYETKDKQVIAEVKGVYYKPVRGQMASNELIDYLYNSTDLGLKN